MCLVLRSDVMSFRIKKPPDQDGGAWGTVGCPLPAHAQDTYDVYQHVHDALPLPDGTKSGCRGVKPNWQIKCRDPAGFFSFIAWIDFLQTGLAMVRYMSPETIRCHPGLFGRVTCRPARPRVPRIRHFYPRSTDPGGDRCLQIPAQPLQSGAFERSGAGRPAADCAQREKREETVMDRRSFLKNAGAWRLCRGGHVAGSTSLCARPAHPDHGHHMGARSGRGA